MMYKAIIIDDEKNAIDVLDSQLSLYCPYIEILAKCQSGKEGIQSIIAHRPDVVFLDIEMPHINGFDVLEATKTLNYHVIFTTAYDQFAIKAIKYSALDYLLKPIDIEELKSATLRIKKVSENDLSYKLSELMMHINTNQSNLDKIAMPFGNGYEMIAFNHIIRAEGDSNYTICYLDDGRKTTLSKTLSEVEKQLPSSTFYRIHNSHLININYISKIFKSDGGYIIMSDGIQINISRSRKDDFWEKIAKF